MFISKYIKMYRADYCLKYFELVVSISYSFPMICIIFLYFLPHGLRAPNTIQAYQGKPQKKALFLVAPPLREGGGVRSVPLRKKDFFLKYGSFSPKIVENLFVKIRFQLF